ncbi:MAG: response regulator [Dehalococcoidia bacterium]|nr:response regulator [Dehalococcoidia bacterium]
MSELDGPVVSARILVVEDNRVNRLVLEHALRREGYDDITAAESAEDGLDAMELVQPDLVFLDLHMPGVDGFTFLAEVRAAQAPGEFLPIVVLTADITEEARRRALSLGATDFLTKPFDRVEVVLRAKNLLASRAAHRAVERERDALEERVAMRTRHLALAQAEVLHRFALLADFRDDDTGSHTRRVGDYSASIAKRLGLPARDVELLRLAAPLHDIGKIGVRDHVLLKPGRLTPEEFEVMKEHTRIGGEMLAGSDFPVLQLAEQVARTHHEWWDGNGYTGLAGEAIPLGSRIVSVADVYDALIHARPYKEAWPVDRALAHMAGAAGTQFDPDVMRAFQAAVAAGEIDEFAPVTPAAVTIPAFAERTESALLARRDAGAAA